ncbi:MAG: MotA/TolQ/ExbB proton channel family protein [Pirellulales bacterium]|nr:MotA/TolQ/ExbB proton channel family protein [Pirellulales bacterium]
MTSRFRSPLAKRPVAPWRWALCLFAFTVAVTAVWAGSAIAQDDEAPAPAAAAPAAPAAGGGDAAEAAAQRQSMLGFYFSALGWRYTIAFLFISFCFVALLVMNLLAARRDQIIPQALVDNFELQLNEKRYQEAFETAKADDSMLGKVLAAGMAQLKQGYAAANNAMQEAGTDENMKLEQRLGYIALIGTISPMVGLLGTVDGMVASFQVIAQSSTSPKPSELAQGISMALITTLVGLWLAIPAIAVHKLLGNRLSRLVFEVGVASENLMGRFADVGKKA